MNTCSDKCPIYFPKLLPVQEQLLHHQCEANNTLSKRNPFRGHKKLQRVVASPDSCVVQRFGIFESPGLSQRITATATSTEGGRGCTCTCAGLPKNFHHAATWKRRDVSCRWHFESVGHRGSCRPNFVQQVEVCCVPRGDLDLFFSSTTGEDAGARASHRSRAVRDVPGLREWSCGGFLLKEVSWVVKFFEIVLLTSNAKCFSPRSSAVPWRHLFVFWIRRSFWLLSAFFSCFLNIQVLLILMLKQTQSHVLREMFFLCSMKCLIFYSWKTSVSGKVFACIVFVFTRFVYSTRSSKPSSCLLNSRPLSVQFTCFQPSFLLFIFMCLWWWSRNLQQDAAIRPLRSFLSRFHFSKIWSFSSNEILSCQHLFSLDIPEDFFFHYILYHQVLYRFIIF